MTLIILKTGGIASLVFTYFVFVMVKTGIAAAKRRPIAKYVQIKKKLSL